MMYRRIIGAFAMLHMIFALAFVCVAALPEGELALDEQAESVRLDGRVLARKLTSTLGIVEATASGQRVVSVSALEQPEQENTESISVSDEEREILERIVEAEAGGEEADGKLLVANVVLNRVASEAFPDTITEVVFQSGQGVTQFSPISDGRFWSVTVSDETREAVESALAGEDISDGALYFTARDAADTDKLTWFDNHLTYLFSYGGHEFFR